MKKQILLTAIFMLFLCQVFAQFKLQKLQVNYQTTPLGTDLSQPQFSWQMTNTTNKRGQAQIAYQIEVTDEQNRIVWNSKRVESDLSHAIQYQGEILKPTTRYRWKLMVWDNFKAFSVNNSWFETGFLNTKIDAWSGAMWIGGGAEDMPLYSHYLSVFKLQYDIQLDKNSNKAAFLFGANDSRLMNKSLNLMAVERKKNESYVSLELDISSLSADTSSRAKLNIYRVGYTADDKVDKPFKTLSIPQNIINNANKFDKHSIYTECNFDLFEFFVDGTDDAHKLKDPNAPPAGRFGPRGINLNPVGSGNNYISFPMLADIGFKTEANQTALFSNIQIKNLRYPSNTIFSENLLANKSIFEGITIENGVYRLSPNTFITANPSRNATPMLRNVFKTEAKSIKKARLYVTARGIYEVYLNGQRISNEYFNPGLTQYNKNHMYQTYDVTASLKNGQANAIGAWLSEGWWSGNITYSGESWNWFGDRQTFLAKMVISYADGSEQIITSNDKDWKIFTDGPIRVGSFFQGEVYDATKEDALKGWTTATYDDKYWKRAVEVPLEGTAVIGDVKYSGRYSASLPYNDFKLVGQMGDNASIVKTLNALNVEEVRPKVFVYDMGQNMVGFPQIKIKNGKKGQVITMRFAEIKYPNLPDYKGNEGMVMMENIRAALTQDQYILKGGDEIIQPRFTFHGYRYLEITGVEQAIPVADVKGLVISSITELASFYETNNALVNKLWQNITWSLRSNFLSIPTDTPARNERMGWSGDISVFSKSATYLTDANLFLRRHLLAMRDIQPDSGRFTDVAPVGGGFGGTLWGSAGIVVAWETYRQYGDIQLLGEHYDAMKKYINFLETKVDKSNGILNEGPLGDWLSPEGNKNDNTLFWMAYFAYDLDIMSQMAAVLGKTDEAKTLKNRSEEIKKAFNEIYVDKATHRTVKSGVKTGFMGPPNAQEAAAKSDKGELIDTQASYAIPLALGTFNAENKAFAVKFLNEAIARKNKDDNGVERPENSLMTGFIGTASISEALSENGSNDLAYKLLVNKQYPSWLYSVVNGATSIWERLNSYTVENGFGGNNSMNSFNHYSFGAVASWMYNYSLGIQRHPQKTGFKEFILKPTPDPSGQISFAKGYYDSMYGRISSEWKNEGSKITYKFTVPANTSAILYLPANKQITESGKSVKIDKTEGDKVLIRLTSGTYVFEVK
ncbi:alpha-L-rhamnosidase [Emticicia oligotrophica]|uniref:alpha-L-rhamnosidase n=1 Tax=Emticicia oligotrophica TaxID=312279 RepID=UPI00273B9B3B|nr:alpha-L-rhamnosidase [Emticicia oligotrophica]